MLSNDLDSICAHIRNNLQMAESTQKYMCKLVEIFYRVKGCGDQSAMWDVIHYVLLFNIPS